MRGWWAAAVLAPGAAWANTPPSDIGTAFPDALSAKEFHAALLVFVFAILVFVMAAGLRRFADFSEDATIRVLALVLIVSGTLFMVTLGYSASQIAPALGLLGTIAGYMLGRADRDKPK